MTRRPLKTAEELERFLGTVRSEPPSRTQADIARLTRKRLGPTWGRKRRRPKGTQ